MSRIGFTGTKFGMTGKQEVGVQRLLAKLAHWDAEFAHGDCVGADAQAHTLAMRLRYKIIIHPGTADGPTRAHCRGAGVVHPVKPFLERDGNIVLSTLLLIAAPQSEFEELRSGTWATVRMARKRNRVIFLVFPTGVIMLDNCTAP